MPRVMLVLLITSVAELVTLLALAGYWHLTRMEQIAPQESEICLPMRKFIIVTDENKHQICPGGLTEVLDNDTKVRKSCCGKMSVVLKSAIDKVLLRLSLYDLIC